jgi:hypothetical protein
MVNTSAIRLTFFREFVNRKVLGRLSGVSIGESPSLAPRPHIAVVNEFAALQEAPRGSQFTGHRTIDCRKARIWRSAGVNSGGELGNEEQVLEGEAGDPARRPSWVR